MKRDIFCCGQIGLYGLNFETKIAVKILQLHADVVFDIFFKFIRFNMKHEIDLFRDELFATKKGLFYMNNKVSHITHLLPHNELFFFFLVVVLDKLKVYVKT
jgi:hypothetical protein